MIGLSVFAGWLTQFVDQCTCQGSDAHYGHQPGCGYEPIATIDEVAQAFAAAGYTLMRPVTAEEEEANVW